MNIIDTIVNDPRHAPYHGWHDDHRAADGTPAYLPAVQQVRAEMVAFLATCAALGLYGACLQLGLGTCDASHELWRAHFDRVVTIDRARCLVDRAPCHGDDTASPDALRLAAMFGPYDLVFIDAGHSFEDVRRDHVTYGPLLKPGGIVAFHDAIARPAYPEVGVPAYVAALPGVQIIGNEVGIAWV